MSVLLQPRKDSVHAVTHKWTPEENAGRSKERLLGADYMGSFLVQIQYAKISDAVVCNKPFKNYCYSDFSSYNSLL